MTITSMGKMRLTAAMVQLAREPIGTLEGELRLVGVDRLRGDSSHDDRRRQLRAERLVEAGVTAEDLRFTALDLLLDARIRRRIVDGRSSIGALMAHRCNALATGTVTARAQVAYARAACSLAELQARLEELLTIAEAQRRPAPTKETAQL